MDFANLLPDYHSTSDTPCVIKETQSTQARVAHEGATPPTHSFPLNQINVAFLPGYTTLESNPASLVRMGSKTAYCSLTGYLKSYPHLVIAQGFGKLK